MFKCTYLVEEFQRHNSLKALWLFSWQAIACNYWPSFPRSTDGNSVTLLYSCIKSEEAMLGWMGGCKKVCHNDFGDCGCPRSQHWFLLTMRAIFFLTFTKLPKSNQNLTIGIADQKTIMSHFGRGWQTIFLAWNKYLYRSRSRMQSVF